jgi:uncharacterized protein (TIGR03435 family)
MPHLGVSIDKDRVDIGSMTLMNLVCFAYKVHPDEVVGGPAWLYSLLNVGRFDILAKMPDGASPEQVPEMLQALLAERFKLAAHREKRVTEVSALTVGKGGPKLKDALPDPPAPAGQAEASTAPGKGTSPSQGAGQPRMKMGENGKIRYESDSMTMERLAVMLSQNLNRPVVDQTGLKGNYQVSYEVNLMAMTRALANKVSRDTGMQSGQDSDPAAAADTESDANGFVFSSLQQLGLKLETRKLPWEVVAIDHIEQTPTEN